MLLRIARATSLVIAITFLVDIASLSSTSLLLGFAAATSLAEKALSFPKEIPVDSTFGQKLLKVARRADPNTLDEGGRATDFAQRKLEAYGGIDYSWLPAYSMKVNGCSHITTWNGDADEDNDVKLKTKRLLRFRLCPSEDCNDDSSFGCSDNYGDYIVDLDIFLANYLEWLQDDLYSKCEEYAWKKCNCYDDGNKDDGFNQYQCEFQCWYKNGKSECYVDYTQDDDAGGFQLDNYMQCSKWYPPGYKRRLEEEDEAVEYYQEEEDDDDGYVEISNNRYYYLGPHCQDSSNVYMGMFLDDTCSQPADSYGGSKGYKYLTGNDLPYSGGNNLLVQKSCLGCYSADANGYQSSMMCQGAYLSAAKCEVNLEVTNSKSESGCNFINGVTYVEQYAGKKWFNPFAYIYAWVDAYPNAFMIGLGAIFGASVLYALAMNWNLQKTVQAREKSKEIAFSAAQVESHYTDVKVKDAFLAM